MDVLAQVLDRVRLGGTLLFHFELGHPWNLELPERPYALFHYLSRGSATLALGEGRDLDLSEGDFVVVTRGEPHTIYSDREARPLSIHDIDRPSARLGVVRHGGATQPVSTIICGNFAVSRPLYGALLELLPPVLLLKPTADGGWLEATLQRMVSESAVERPGQAVALSRLTEVLFVEVLRSWMKTSQSRRRGMARRHGGPAYRAGASIDPRTPGSALGPQRPRPSRGSRSLGVFGPLHQTRRPTDASLSDRPPDDGGCVSARSQRRADCPDREPRGLRDRRRVFKAVPPASWSNARPVPGRAATAAEAECDRGSSSTRGTFQARAPRSHTAISRSSRTP